MSTNLRTSLLAVVAAGAILAGCTAGDDSSTESGSGGSTPATVATGPAPGVTDDSVKIGITYVDLASLGVVTLDHGDYVGSYTALIDAINAEGGINGRTIDPVIVGVNPVGTDAADAACVQLTQDEQVFLIMGYFGGDAVLCPLETHQTAALGGEMTPQRLERAQAPWYTVELGSDTEADAIRAMADAGELDGTLGVFADPAEETQMDDVVLPLLDELGVEVAEHAVVDAPATDTAAVNAATQVIAERFDSSGVDTVLTVGQSSLVWATGTEPLDYRPELRITNTNSMLAFIGEAASHDLSLLDGAVGANLYGDVDNQWRLPPMEECVGVIEDAGVEVPDPTTAAPNAPERWVAPMVACNFVALLRGVLEASGDELNYGSMAAGVDGTEILIPNQPEPLTYGPAPAGDGDPTIYLYDWDADAGAFAIRD